ncbi:hypothetical protein ASF80_09885 [Microbacterium sp. Leaf159]|nr:hypothetical protein ASF80_09885 [Microbacterium sp. Leaf159]
MPIPFVPVAALRMSLRERVEEQISDAILDGTLEPGEVLHDAELQTWLGVSKQPIREALNNLSRIGLVETAPQSYTRVAAPDPKDRTAVLQTLGALMGGVVRVTVPVLSTRQRGTLLGLLDRVEPLVESHDLRRLVALGWQLIDLFITHCPNPVLVSTTREVVRGLAFHLSATRAQGNADWASVAAGCPALRDALVVGDALAAEHAIKKAFRLSAP